ncbi:MAG: CarD family transcriptional regulator [Candidatus Neomarinimicrobiota bacterium]
MKQKQKNVFKKEILENLLKGFKATGLTADSTILLLQELALRTDKNILVSTENQEAAFDTYNRGHEHNNSIFTYFPDSRGENSVPGFEKENTRHQKESMLKTSTGDGVICVGTLTSFKENIISQEYKKHIKKTELSIGLKLDRESLIQFLEDLNYNQVGVVESPSEYNFRGDIVDFFSPFFKNPIRVSFFFDEIESLCVFDPKNQQPAGNLKKVEIKEAKNTQSVNNINLIEHANPSFLFFYETGKGEMALFDKRKTEKVSFSFSGFATNQNLSHEDSVGLSVFLKHFNSIYYVSKKKTTPDFLQNFSIQQVYGSIESGFYSKKHGFAVLGENDFFDVYSQSGRWQPKQSKTAIEVTAKNLSRLKSGDLVVHESFGIGLYRGPIEKSFKIGVREGVELEYKNNTTLFVSMEQLGFIHRYVGSGKTPALSVLGSKKWQTEVKKAKESAREVVYEIFSLYSKKNHKQKF